jgi:membrane protein implicated in regulation of membrane protease activity
MTIAFISFSAWFNEMVLVQQVFYGIGIFALVIVILQMILMALGVGIDGLEGLDLDMDIDVDTDLGDSDGTGGLSLLSVQTLTSFFFAFGWVGGIAMGKGASIPVACLLALLAGMLFMYASWFLLKKLLSLQSKGNLKYESAIGQKARVYVTLPGNGEDGGGQIELNLQSRLITASARKLSPGPARPGETVTITGADGTTYFVEPEPENPETP